jgi:sn-glycerol 3-phosphate transport system permease protein
VQHEIGGGTIPTSIAIAILMALWVNRRIPGRGLVRLAYFTPTVLPMIAVANVWLFFYTPEIGLLDQVVGLFGGGGHNWLGDPATVSACRPSSPRRPPSKARAAVPSSGG